MHFTVLVIGEDVEGQLEPYDENLDDYDDDEEENYNHMGKWDWYEIGGRWSGFFRAKRNRTGVKYGYTDFVDGKIKKVYPEGKWFDQIYKKDLDIKYMRDLAGRDAAKRYDKVMEVIGNLPKNKTFAELETTINDRTQLRELYWDQPRCKAWSAAKFGFWSSPDDFLVDRDTYINNKRRGVLVTLAYISEDGTWHENPDAWEFKPIPDWDNEMTNMIENLHDDTLLTLVDCHV